MPHFNPRSPCGERQLRTAFQIQKFYISIHAPRAGSDGNLRLHCPLHCQISIHAPRAGSDQSVCRCCCGTLISIHAPRAGSNRVCLTTKNELFYFNPRSPCGERHRGGQPALRQERFQSTLPVRGATFVLWSRERLYRISIHAPRAGSDHTRHSHFLRLSDFNPRSPCGERPKIRLTGATISLFQSTLPVRGATDRSRGGREKSSNFNPRSPCGERLPWLRLW